MAKRATKVHASTPGTTIHLTQPDMEYSSTSGY